MWWTSVVGVVAGVSAAGGAALFEGGTRWPGVTERRTTASRMMGRRAAGEGQGQGQGVREDRAVDATQVGQSGTGGHRATWSAWAQVMVPGVPVEPPEDRVAPRMICAMLRVARFPDMMKWSGEERLVFLEDRRAVSNQMLRWWLRVTMQL